MLIWYLQLKSLKFNFQLNNVIISFYFLQGGDIWLVRIILFINPSVQYAGL